jgi:hypothetical protein
MRVRVNSHLQAEELWPKVLPEAVENLLGYTPICWSALPRGQFYMPPGHMMGVQAMGAAAGAIPIAPPPPQKQQSKSTKHKAEQSSKKKRVSYGLIDAQEEEEDEEAASYGLLDDMPSSYGLRNAMLGQQAHTRAYRLPIRSHPPPAFAGRRTMGQGLAAGR